MRRRRKGKRRIRFRLSVVHFECGKYSVVIKHYESGNSTGICIPHPRKRIRPPGRVWRRTFEAEQQVDDVRLLGLCLPPVAPLVSLRTDRAAAHPPNQPSTTDRPDFKLLRKQEPIIARTSFIFCYACTNQLLERGEARELPNGGINHRAMDKRYTSSVVEAQNLVVLVLLVFSCSPHLFLHSARLQFSWRDY